MSTAILRRILGMVLAVGLAFTAAPAAAGDGPYAGVPAAVSLTASSFERAVVTAASVREGDVLFFFGPQPPEVAGLTWERAGDGEQGRWQTRAEADGALEMVLAVESLPLGEVLMVGINRTLGDGSILQTNRQLRLDEQGLLEEGPSGAARIRSGYRITPGPGATLPVGAERDAAGRLLVDASSPGLAAALAGAREVTPYVTAEVMGGMAVGSVTDTNDQNVPFTNELCGGPYYGSPLYIDSAPAGATVIGTDISYRVYHSVDISKFQVAAFRGGIGGYVQTDFVYLYQRTQSGSTILNKTHLNLSDFNGRTVNYQYLVGCCNFANNNYGYLDSWTITLYFTETTSPTIDLVADSIAAGPTTVAAGGSTSVLFSGHVGGSGTVGGNFGLGIVLSTDSALNTGDQLLWSQISNWGSAPPDSFGFGSPGISVTIPGGTSAGTYFLGFFVDHTQIIDETNENNNIVWTAITVLAAGSKPNLHAVSCSVSPNSTTAGSTVTFTSRGQNNGTAGASTFVWGIYLSNDAVIDPTADGPALVALDYPGGWNAGYDSGDVPRSVPLPAGLSDGTYYLGIYFDSGKIISETNEGDNYCSAILTIGSGGGGGGGATTWFLPAAAAATGFGGAVWTGQVEITNPTSATRTATLYYVPKGQSWPGSVLSGPHSIGANQAWYISDPVGAMNPTTGMLYVAFDQAGPRVNSRVFAVAPDGSSYGQGIPGIPLYAMPGTEQVIAPVHSQSGVYHANLGLVHPGTGSYTVEVSIYSSGGSLLALKSYTRSQAWEQIDNVFADMGIGGTSVTGAWVKVRVTSGSNVWAYISLVDDRTKDPTFLWDLALLYP